MPTENLMRKVARIACEADQEAGIDLNKIAELCPDHTRKQVSAALTNALHRALIRRITAGGNGQATYTQPAVYAPPRPAQRESVSITRRKMRRRDRAAEVPPLPVRARRRPASSIWDYAQRVGA